MVKMDEFNISYHFDEDTLKELKRRIAVFGPDFELVAVYKDFLFRDMKSRLGHESKKVTLDIYYHIQRDNNSEILLDGLI